MVLDGGRLECTLKQYSTRHLMLTNIFTHLGTLLTAWMRTTAEEPKEWEPPAGFYTNSRFKAKSLSDHLRTGMKIEIHCRVEECIPMKYSLPTKLNYWDDTHSQALRACSGGMPPSDVSNAAWTEYRSYEEMVAELKQIEEWQINRLRNYD